MATNSSSESATPCVIKCGQVFSIVNNTSCNLVLNESAIIGEQADSKCLFAFPLEDVLGLTVLTIPPPAKAKSNCCRVELFTYCKTTKLLSKATSRNIHKETLEFTEGDDFDFNLRIAKEWREAIASQRIKSNKKTFINLQDCEELQQNRFLVIINPFAGSKQSLHLYRTIALPIFELSGATIVQELLTERQGHAQEFMKDYNLSHITGIVIAAGDGTLYEVVNGLMSRPDWETAIKTPIGILPTGSGNAIAASLLYEADEENSVRNAAFIIINGGVQSHDIASLMTQSTHVYIAVIVNWAFTGDIDIESERLRFLGGNIRFILGALKCIAFKRCYQGRFSYLPLDENESASNDDATAVDPLSTHLLSPIDAPVPDNWTTVEGSFAVFIAQQSSHLSQEFQLFPEVQLGSGQMHILYALEDLKRSEIVSAVVDTTRIPNINTVHTVSTKAFRLEPISPGILTVDGENFEYTPVQVQVHPGLMRLFSRKRQS